MLYNNGTHIAILWLKLIVSIFFEKTFYCSGIIYKSNNNFTIASG